MQREVLNINIILRLNFVKSYIGKYKLLNDYELVQIQERKRIARLFKGIKF